MVMPVSIRIIFPEWGGVHLIDEVGVGEHIVDDLARVAVPHLKVIYHP
jgi:hypothetical protein